MPASVRLLRVAAAPVFLCACLVLTGCSTSQPTAEQLAGKIGCESFTEVADEFAEEGGTCAVDGVDVSVYTFTNRPSQTTWIDAARGLGATAVLVGRTFVVYSDSEPLLERAREKVGGTIRR